MFNSTINYGIFNPGTECPLVRKKHTTGYLLLVLACALIYGGVLTALPLDEFRDRDNYLRYARSSWDTLEFYWAISPLVALANEPLWLLINAGLAKVFSPETVLRLIIFFPASLVAWNILRQDSRQFIWLPPIAPAEILEKGKYGRLVPVGNAETLAEGILAALDGTTNSEALQYRAKEFSYDDIADQYLEVLHGCD